MKKISAGIFRTIVAWRLALSAALVCVLASGCASYLARKNMENVAKGWCQMIRASQVIPVYPLTEDLMVGDVFLVQTPISMQAADYRKRGFLPLDDAQVRLAYTNFSKIYFNGYWKDEFGNTPHPVPVFKGGDAAALTEAPLPRAAFPTYSFQAKSGFGFNAAFPIEGVPVALSYLNSQEVNGSVTIADARTYGGDTGQLLELLRQWAQTPATRDELAATARNAAPTKVFLRVVSRVYYVRSLDISLERSGSQGASGKGGTVNDVSLLASNGDVNPNYSNLLTALTAAATTVASAAQVGGAVKFVSASKSTVGLSQSFDRLLAIGYLGFDVQVDTNGDLGTPIPTFQYLTGQIPTPAAPTKFGPDANSAKIRAWLKTPAAPAHEEQLRGWLGEPMVGKFGIGNILNSGQFSDVRSNIVTEFKINSPDGP
jgi:hypothetical protein